MSDRTPSLSTDEQERLRAELAAQDERERELNERAYQAAVTGVEPKPGNGPWVHKDQIKPARLVHSEPGFKVIEGPGYQPPHKAPTPYVGAHHPDHYGGRADPYEAIKVIEAWGLGFSLGNAIKYIRRAGSKPGSSAKADLQKAAWYLLRELEKAEGTQPDHYNDAILRAHQETVF